MFEVTAHITLFLALSCSDCSSVNALLRSSSGPVGDYGSADFNDS